MSLLLAASVDGQKLNEEELLDFCKLLLLAGHETTAHLLGNAVICFDAYPDIAQQVRADPSLITSAVEEILRCFPSVSGALRRATQEVILDGQRIEQGQSIMVQAVSANYARLPLSARDPLAEHQSSACLRGSYPAGCRM